MPLKPYPGYKETGLPWLGEVPGHWKVRQLGRIGRFSKGNGGTKEDEVPNGVSCVRYGDLYMNHEFSIRKSRSYVTRERAVNYTPILYGDLLFAGSGETIEEIGKSAVNLIESEACCGGDVILFRPSIDVEPQFMGYAANCHHAVYQKACMGRGVTVMHIYGDQLKYMWIALPPLPEQAAIARYLNHTDRCINRLIRAKRRHIELLNEEKQAIIHQAVTRGLDPNVRLKPSGIDCLGDVPEHWEVKRLRHISPSITVGVVVNPSSYFTDNGVPFLLGNNVLPGHFRLDTVRYISEKSNHLLAKSRLNFGDLVVVRVGAPGVAAVIDVALEGCNCASMMIVRQGSTFASDWLMYLFNSPVLRSQIDRVKYGAAQKQFNISHAVNFWCPVPPKSEQHEIVAFLYGEVSGLDSAMADAQKVIELLREYRTRLIADVVTGKLDVRGVELPELDDDSELEYLDVEETSGLDGPDESSEDLNDDE